MKILVWYYWRSRSESAFIDVIYSVGVIPEIFLNCLENNGWKSIPEILKSA